MTEREARMWTALIYIVLVFLLPIPTIPWLAWRATAPKWTDGRS